MVPGEGRALHGARDAAACSSGGVPHAGPVLKQPPTPRLGLADLDITALLSFRRKEIALRLASDMLVKARAETDLHHDDDLRSSMGRRRSPLPSEYLLRDFATSACSLFEKCPLAVEHLFKMAGDRANREIFAVPLPDKQPCFARRRNGSRQARSQLPFSASDIMRQERDARAGKSRYRLSKLVTGAKGEP